MIEAQRLDLEPMGKREYRDHLIEEILQLSRNKSENLRWRYQLEGRTIPEIEEHLSRMQEKYAPKTTLLDRLNSDMLIITYTTAMFGEVEIARLTTKAAFREHYERIASVIAEQLLSPIHLHSVRWYLCQGGKLRQEGRYNKDWQEVQR